MMSRLVGLVLLTGLTATVSAADIYKWIDQEGRVHYGDRPQATSSQPMNIDALPAVPPSAGDSYERRLEKQRRLLDAYDKERAERKAKAEKQSQSKQQRKRNCGIAEDRLRAIRQAGFLYDVDEAGERRVYSDPERQKATAHAERDVAKWCN